MENQPKHWSVLLPAVCIVAFGTIGNAFTLITVLNKRCKKTSFIVVLAALAITDSIVLASAPLYTMLKSFSVFSCKFFTFCLRGSRHISVWLVVVLTVERMFVVYFPSKVKDICVPKTGFVVVASVIAILLASDAHLLFGVTLITFENKTECGSKNTGFENFYAFYFPWIDLTIGFILPAIVIIVANSAILVRTRKSTDALTTNAITTTTQTIRKDKQRHLLRTTLLVSMAYIVLYMPRLVYAVSRPYIHDLSGTAFVHVNEDDINTSAVVNFLVLLNHGINFMLYVFSSKRFRNELKNTLCWSPATVGIESSINTVRTNALRQRLPSDRILKWRNEIQMSMMSRKTKCEEVNVRLSSDAKKCDQTIVLGYQQRSDVRECNCDFAMP